MTDVVTAVMITQMVTVMELVPLCPAGDMADDMAVTAKIFPTFLRVLQNTTFLQYMVSMCGIFKLYIVQICCFATPSFCAVFQLLLWSRMYIRTNQSIIRIRSASGSLLTYRAAAEE